MGLGLILGEALTGLRRNASMVISVVLVTFVSLTFVGAAMLMQMQIMTMKDFWSDRAQVAVSMCTPVSIAATCTTGVATQEQLDAVESQLESTTLSPLIQEWRFETSEEAYVNLVALVGADEAGVLTAEQMPQTYYVNLVDPGQADVILEAFSATEGVEVVKDQLQFLDPLFSALTILTYIAIGIASLMLIAAVLLIATTIRLSAFARRRELSIMRLVGASNRFIQTPFILEGVFAALIGSALASGVVWAGVHFGVQGYLAPRVGFITNWVGASELAIVTPVIVIIGVVLAGLSAAFAIRRWLRA